MKIQLRLYVGDETAPAAAEALQIVQFLAEQCFAGRCELKVLAAQENASAVRKDRVSILPGLVVESGECKVVIPYAVDRVRVMNALRERRLIPE